MKVLSLFSGVGGFDLGLEAAGMETVFQCEWDKHCNTILNRHWPLVPKWDDVSTLTGEYVLTHAPVVDVVAWGSPCQDLSLAGKRAGLAGEKSGLFHEGIRIIKEMREKSNGQYPRISIWENVYGALSSNGGADFGVIVDQMAEAGALVIEWAVLDAQHFGVPQRRRRVFVVAIFDSAIAERCPEPLLPVAESMPRDSKTRKQKGQSVTSETATGFGSNNFAGWAETDTAITLSARDHKSSNNMVLEPAREIVGSLQARDYKGVGNQYVSEGKCIVEPFVKSRRAQTVDDNETWIHGEVNPTLNSFDMGDHRTTTTIVEQLVLFENSYRDGARIANDGVTQTLSAKMGTGGGNTPMIAYGITGHAIGRQDHNGPNGPSHTPEGGPMFTLTGTDVHAVATAMQVRRLTPLECERLMGWEPEWTRWKADGTEQADSHRYKQCGNGVASCVAEWVGKQIMNLEGTHNDR